MMDASKMIKEVSVKKVKDDAAELYRAGKFYCSEAIVSSVRDNFQVDMPKEGIAMASGFPVGVGKSKSMCGAVSGGVMCLGYFFGRTEGSSPADPKVVRTLQLANELQASFKENHKVLCCKVLTNGMDMASGEHKAQCVAFTGEVAEKVAEIVTRELGIKNTDVAV
jgi:C_GCAxxG_C_C family probable redox protein